MKQKLTLFLAVVFSLFSLYACGDSSDSGGFVYEEKNCQLTSYSLNFGSVVLGQSSKKSFSVKVRTPTSLSVNVVSASGGFTVTPETVQTSLSDETVTIEVTFTPNSSATFSGVVRIKESAGSVYEVYLTGNGTNGEGAATGTLMPEITLSETSFSDGTISYITIHKSSSVIPKLSLHIGTSFETSEVILETDHVSFEISTYLLYFYGVMMNATSSSQVPINKDLSYNFYLRACDDKGSCEIKTIPITFK